MKFSVLSSAAFALCALASPAQLRPRDYTVTDVTILNYALTLEHLEDNFYRTGLAKFKAADFIAAGFSQDTYDKFSLISSDETTHVSFLTAALKAAGAPATAECTYNFPLTDVKTFVTVASILEGVGVSAYLGAAADIMSKTYLTAAGSILTVEARHSSYIRNSLGEKPFPTPFDVPLSLNEVYTLAAQFITSCPSTNPALPVKAFPTLTASPSNAKVLQTGSTITLLTPGYKLVSSTGSAPIYAAFITVTGPVFAPATPIDGGFTVVIPGAPAGTAPIGGQTYVVLTSCNTTVSDDTVAAGPAIIEVSN